MQAQVVFVWCAWQRQNYDCQTDNRLFRIGNLDSTHIVEDGQFVKLFDAAIHETVNNKSQSLLKTHDHDARWVKIRRPTVIVGGELTLDTLEIRHDPVNNVGEAALQMKK